MDHQVFQTRSRDRDADSDSEHEDATANEKKIITPDTDAASEELVKIDSADIGMSIGLKHLYSGKEDKRGRFDWQKTIPEDLGKPAEDAESEKWAIVVRHVRVYNDPTKVLCMHSILVQSPLLKELLADVLADYPGVTVSLSRLEFKGRFEPLIHRWTQMQDAIAALKAKREAGTGDDKIDARIEHAELLHDLLAKEFADTIEAHSDLASNGVMVYDHMWTIFQPGSFIYNKQQGQDRVLRLESSTYGQDRYGNPVYWLNCKFIDFDGSTFGTNRLNAMISHFEGTKAITSLPTFPLQFHSRAEEVKAKLIERGGKVEALAGAHYRSYNGIGWRTVDCRREKHAIRGRIVIDTNGWNRFNPGSAVSVRPLHAKENVVTNDDSEDEGDDDFDEGYDIDDSGMPSDGQFEDEAESVERRRPLTDDQKMMCTPLIRGYALKDKIWLNFFVNAVQDITFSEKAFESLVLPKNQKELILGFTSTQQSYRSQFDDVIEGKGRGIILLLCGPPGVGKTLTAESVAEQMRVPLFMMSAGDLGLDPSTVESKLQDILEVCARWNAILLLDEADVFLEERSLHELERNKLVSIFLRVLEYYEGIMFLTTNRVQTFDAAFQSRIHISLEYPELDINSRKTIWQNFLEQHNKAQVSARERPLRMSVSAAKAQQSAVASGEKDADALAAEAEKYRSERTLPHAMTEKDVANLATLKMNGRQIKNVLKTAQLLASQRGQGLSFEHVKVVMDVTQHLHNSTRENAVTKSAYFN